MEDNLYRLSCQKNESGFLRINIPIISSVRNEFSYVSKLRLNYWSPDTGVEISPESIHTHPVYFESLVINGGYTHSVYDSDVKTGTIYDAYNITKENEKKTFAFLGSFPLQHVNDESFKSNDIIIFDKYLTHKVIKTEPQTLSFNVIFMPLDNEHPNYNLYLTRDCPPSAVKTSRETITNKKSKPYINLIISNLINFIKTI